MHITLIRLTYYLTLNYCFCNSERFDNEMFGSSVSSSEFTFKSIINYIKRMLFLQRKCLCNQNFNILHSPLFCWKLLQKQNHFVFFHLPQIKGKFEKNCQNHEIAKIVPRKIDNQIIFN